MFWWPMVCALRGLAAGLDQVKLAPVAFEGSCTMPQPHDGAFRDRPRALRVFGDQRPKHLPVPGLRMLHIQHGVHREIMPFSCRYTEAAQSLIHISGSCRRGHLDDAKSA